MRIRKNAKISPLIYAAASLKPGTVLQLYDCQLNQSPWDVMNFTPPPPTTDPPPPPPPSQVHRNGAYSANGSSENCVSVVEREFNKWRIWEYTNDLTGDDTETDEADEMEVEVEQPPPAKEEPVIMCCKTDGKSWQCRKEAAKDNSLCEHHLAQARSYNSSSNQGSRKTGKQVAAAAVAEEEAHPPMQQPPRPSSPPLPTRRPRQKKAATSSNPYEFYYYSGFGPRWGKKRGEASSNDGGGNSIISNVPKNPEHEHEIEPEPPSPTLAVSPLDDEEEYDDFIEYEDDEEDDHEETKGNGKKRGRKPIKAMSLQRLLSR